MISAHCSNVWGAYLTCHRSWGEHLQHWVKKKLSNENQDWAFTIIRHHNDRYSITFSTSINHRMSSYLGELVYALHSFWLESNVLLIFSTRILFLLGSYNWIGSKKIKINACVLVMNSALALRFHVLATVYWNKRWNS